jgi:hypothetical protein
VPPLQFNVSERVKEFLVDWDESNREWISNEIHNEAVTVQISVSAPDLLTMIDKAQAFVDSDC